ASSGPCTPWPTATGSAGGWRSGIEVARRRRSPPRRSPSGGGQRPVAAGFDPVEEGRGSEDQGGTRPEPDRGLLAEQDPADQRAKRHLQIAEWLQVGRVGGPVGEGQQILGDPG